MTALPPKSDIGQDEDSSALGHKGHLSSGTACSTDRETEW